MTPMTPGLHWYISNHFSVQIGKLLYLVFVLHSTFWERGVCPISLHPPMKIHRLIQEYIDSKIGFQRIFHNSGTL